jgi:hypothetical protein
VRKSYSTEPHNLFDIKAGIPRALYREAGKQWRDLVDIFFFLEKGSKLIYKLLTVATSFQDQLCAKQLWENIHGMFSLPAVFTLLSRAQLQQQWRTLLNTAMGYCKRQGIS